MKISVIVPCLTRDAAAERCLDEIRRQAASGEAELDLVVVEGVSPCGKARNEGLRRATGDYVAWVDADDEVLDGWWRAICEALAERPDVVVFGLHDERLGADVIYPLSEAEPSRHLLRSVLRDAAPYSYLVTKVIRRELWSGEWFDEKLRLMTDFVLLPRVLSRAKSVRVIEKVLYVYRYHEASTSRRSLPGKDEELFSICWQRFEDWRNTDFEPDALVPFVMQVSWRFESVVSKGLEPSCDALLASQMQRLRGLFPLVVRAGVGWRIAAKIAFASLGWTWPQRLFFWIHGVK